MARSPLDVVLRERRAAGDALVDPATGLNADILRAAALSDKREYARLLEEKVRLAEGLPFLHGWKFYSWAREFFESRNKFNFICAANQVSKSSTQIRRVIELATNKQKWDMWRRRPLQFWYLYPTKDVATIEVDKKWIPEFLPRNEYKSDATYGWRVETKNKYVFALHFHSGVSVFFKSYAMSTQDLQTGTCDAIFWDEELPVEGSLDLWSELCMRLASTDGYMHGVFTPTLNQEFWRCVMEETGAREKLKGALKINVSMFDCLTYEDGSPSHWTVEQIQRAINACKSDAEIQRRIYGRFVSEEGLKYPGFDRKRNIKRGHPIPLNWLIHAAVDPGSGGKSAGGKKAHPPAIAFIGVSPDYRQGRVFKAWRGDDGSTYTAGDVFNKYVELREQMDVICKYDWAAKDFATIAERNGEPMLPAEKGHEIGEQILNVLFKNSMLHLYEEEGENGIELEKVAQEFATLRRDTPKTRAADNLCDAVRYAAADVPWDFTCIKGETLEAPPDGPEETPDQKHLRERREYYESGHETQIDAVKECTEFQAMLEGHEDSFDC